MARRLTPARDPVTIELDGQIVEAERGEPLAWALIASDRLALARSPKLHRPHGPTCLRGGCDGCLSRVDGVPNVRTCLAPTRGGERVETQNVIGARDADLLRVTDWFFPHGFDHHRLLVGVPGVSAVMTRLARRMGGLGRLPDDPHPAPPAARREVDLLVVGAGAAGLVVAHRAASAGLSTLVVDDAPAPGGSLRARGPNAAESFVARARGAGATLLASATAAGVYDAEVLVVDASGATIVRPRRLVLASGAHDGLLPFAGNDVPGVTSARAAALLACHGIAIGARIAIVGDGPYARALALQLEGHAELTRLPASRELVVRGAARVRGVELGGERHRVDAVCVEVPGAPAFELAVQAGARASLDLARGGYVPHADGDGRVREGVYCAGEVAGTGSDLDAIVAQAERVAAAVVTSR